MLSTITDRQLERFYERLKQEGECLVWPGGKDNGYGVTGIGVRSEGTSRGVFTHRLAWALEHGPIPPGMCICHHCDNPPCCRPEHLFLGTRADNNRDMFAKGRNVKGEGAWKSRLSEQDFQAIRASDESIGVLAKIYDVIPATIGHVLRHRSWKHAGGARQTRVRRGEDARAAILTEDDVYEIRASKETLRVLAARFGVGVTTIWMAKHRKSWKYLPVDDLEALFG